MSERPTTVLLAWGNPGRLDDGLGPALAERASAWGLAGLKVDSGYQLQVEDADQAARHRRVVFVDADRTGPEPYRVQRIRAGAAGLAFSSHSVDPESLLALARDLFGAEPEAWLVGIRGYEFDSFGERLSSGARSNLVAAADFLEHALRSGHFHEVRPQSSEVSHARPMSADPVR